jgi:hypothetical protein
MFLQEEFFEKNKNFLIDFRCDAEKTKYGQKLQNIVFCERKNGRC